MEEKDPKGLMEGKDVYKFGWICNKKTVCFVFYTHINTNRTEPLGFPRQIGDTERTYLRGCVIVRIKISNLSTSSCPWSLSSLIAKKKPSQNTLSLSVHRELSRRSLTVSLLSFRGHDFRNLHTLLHGSPSVSLSSAKEDHLPAAREPSKQPVKTCFWKIHAWKKLIFEKKSTFYLMYDVWRHTRAAVEG